MAQLFGFGSGQCFLSNNFLVTKKILQTRMVNCTVNPINILKQTNIHLYVHKNELMIGYTNLQKLCIRREVFHHEQRKKTVYFLTVFRSLGVTGEHRTIIFGDKRISILA